MYSFRAIRPHLLSVFHYRLLRCFYYLLPTQSLRGSSSAWCKSLASVRAPSLVRLFLVVIRKFAFYEYKVMTWHSWLDSFRLSMCLCASLVVVVGVWGCVSVCVPPTPICLWGQLSLSLFCVLLSLCCLFCFSSQHLLFLLLILFFSLVSKGQYEFNFIRNDQHFSGDMLPI